MHTVPVTLENERVRLEPLSMDHADALCSVGLDPAIWDVGLHRIRTGEEMTEYVREAMEQRNRGSALPFAIVDRSTGTVAGSTRYMNIDRANRRVEIGSTWLGKNWQRTALNTESKFLMLEYAFEVWHALRVEFKTDVLNERSRSAIRRLGAKEEGILRKHAITSTGRVRDTVYYSIIDDEWTAVKEHFATHLRRK